MLNGQDVPVTGRTSDVAGTFTVDDAGTRLESADFTVDLSTVARDSDQVQIVSSSPITFADYGIEAPSLGFVSVEDQGSIEV